MTRLAGTSRCALGSPCTTNGSSCGVAGECCSLNCAAVGVCRSNGEPCRKSSDCCGFYSTSKGGNPVCEAFCDPGNNRCYPLIN